MKKSFFFLTLSLLFLVGCGTPSDSQSNSYSTTQADTPTSPQVAQEPVLAPDKKPQPMNLEIDQNKTYTAILHTTEGNIEVSLNAKQTPITVNNFVTLAKKNFYDKTIFHRVLKGFMIQGGDPTGTGSGGPGYKFDDEPFEGEYTRGTLAMANAGPNTNGSQFFIMHGDVPLQKDYVIFGKVTKGMEVVDKIATAKVTNNEMGEPSKPVNPVKITSIDILEK